RPLPTVKLRFCDSEAADQLPASRSIGPARLDHRSHARLCLRGHTPDMKRRQDKTTPDLRSPKPTGLDAANLSRYFLLLPRKTHSRAKAQAESPADQQETTWRPSSSGSVMLRSQPDWDARSNRLVGAEEF